jgi:hypothetical protein
MTRTAILTPEFVDHIPERLEPGYLYISMKYATVMHQCCCGCGEQVVTPLSPTDWKLSFDGEHISLSPSIGNWSFACQSHYWIQKNSIEWSGQWSKSKIDAGRRQDRDAKEFYFSKLDDGSLVNSEQASVSDIASRPVPTVPIWSRVWVWLKRWWRNV